jgi:hypothetical protein
MTPRTTPPTTTPSTPAAPTPTAPTPTATAHAPARARVDAPTGAVAAAPRSTGAAAPAHALVRPAERAGSAPRRPRPDPRPMRLALGMAGVATLSALGTAILVPPQAPASQATSVTTGQTASTATTRVRHVTQYVQLAPGQTAPPQATVEAVPTPAPKVVIVTRQSGKP